MSNPTSPTIERALGQAASAIAANERYHKTKAEQRLNHLGTLRSWALRFPAKLFILGDDVQKIVQIATVDGALTDSNTSDAFSVIKQKIDTFVEDSKVVMSILDEIGKIHPFIQSRSSVVVAFKAAISDVLSFSSCGVCV